MDYNKKMHTLVDKYFDEALNFTKDLIKIKSVLDENKMNAEHPFGENLTDALVAFLEHATFIGFKTKNINNASGYAEFGEGGQLIGILCHLDVMPEGKVELWNTPPFEGIISNGKLYGRGSMDDKGPAAISLYAIKALNDCGVHLNNRYRLIIGLDEETGFSRCLAQYLKYEETPDYSFSPDAYFPIINAEKGILRFNLLGENSSDVLISINAGDRYNVVPEEAIAIFKGNMAQTLNKVINEDCTINVTDSETKLIVKGVSAHAMEPEKGKNALQILLNIIVEAGLAPVEILKLEKILKMDIDGKSIGIACNDEISGMLTFNVAAIEMDNNKIKVKFDIRYPVTANYDTIMKNILSASTNAGYKVEIIQNKPPLHLAADLPFIQKLLSAYNDVTGTIGKPFAIGGGTYCRFLKNSVSFGPIFPGEVETAHQPNEHISIDSLRKAMHVYAEALYRMNADN